MPRSALLSFTALLVLAGCADPVPMDDSPPMIVLDDGPGATTKVVVFPDFSLSTRGSYQAAGTYIHPGLASVYDPETYNCISFHVANSKVLFVNATAQWADGSRLALHHRLKNDNDPYRDGQHVIGSSPLVHVGDVQGQRPPQYIFIGVEPAPDLPIGAGMTDGITFHVEMSYAGEVEPTFRNMNYCSYDIH